MRAESQAVVLGFGQPQIRPARLLILVLGLKQHISKTQNSFWKGRAGSHPQHRACPPCKQGPPSSGGLPPREAFLPTCTWRTRRCLCTSGPCPHCHGLHVAPASSRSPAFCTAGTPSIGWIRRVSQGAAPGNGMCVSRTTGGKRGARVCMGGGTGSLRGHQARASALPGASPVPRTAWLQDAAPGHTGTVLTHVHGAGTPVPSGAGAEAAARAAPGGAPRACSRLPVGAAATLQLAQRSGPPPAARGTGTPRRRAAPSPRAARCRLQPTEFGKPWRKTPDTQTCRLNRACGRAAAVRGPHGGQRGSSVTGGQCPAPREVTEKGPFVPPAHVQAAFEETGLHTCIKGAPFPTRAVRMLLGSGQEVQGPARD